MASAITPAASVLLTRGPGSPDVYLVRRGENLRFFGGFWAFPGGKVAAADEALLPGASDSISHDDRRLAVRRLAVARELFEETGVLVARRADGSFLSEAPQLHQRRRDLLAESISFPNLLAEFGLSVRSEDFRPIGDVTTPEFAPLRYETTFFVAHLPPGQQPEVWPGELETGCFASARDMLGRWVRGDCLLSPPTIMTLQAIEGRAADEAPARLADLLRSLAGGRIHPIFVAPHVQLIPLKTVALPPAAYTNAYLAGAGPTYLLDPGAHEQSEQHRLFDLLDDLVASGRGLTAIVLTHHHPDHVDAAAACAQRYGAPIWAHPETARLLKSKINVDRFLHADAGDRLDLGPCPDGGGPWFLETLHTPGHAPGHLAFYEPRYRLLFAADMVSTITSIIIAPPEGDLAVYLQSLERLRDLDNRLLLPAHGNVSARPHQVLDDALHHRAKREAQLLQALASGPRIIADLAAELYKGLPEKSMRFARLQILAGLHKLERDGRAECVGPDTWRLR